jgi:hypothetical protein
MFTDRLCAVHHFGEIVVRVDLHRESILHVKQLHQHATRQLVGITEPGLADWAARRGVGGESTKAITTPHASNKTRGEELRVARCRLSHGESLGE